MDASAALAGAGRLLTSHASAPRSDVVRPSPGGTMEQLPRRTIKIVAPLLSLLLIAFGAAASSQHSTPIAQRGTAIAAPAAGNSASARLNERGLITYWWNDGSCHGYPDVMIIYAVELDGNGNVVEYRYAGATAGS